MGCYLFLSNGHIYLIFNAQNKIRMQIAEYLLRINYDYNLVVDIAWGKEAEGVWEHGVEEIIWT